jgi:endonuclease/exonuclease/phosphatase family metal-dependent hydrolase
LWVAPAIQHMVSSSGHSRRGRAQWVRLAGIPGGDINIINLYASTDLAVRIELWKELIRVLPRDCRSILVGDFNFVENRTNKSSMCGKLIPVGEKIVFTQLTSLLGVEDNFSPSGPIRFTWDNKRRDGMRVLARLDRIYVFQATAPGLEPVEEYVIKGDSVFSDHLAVWYKLALLSKPKRRSTYKMSTFFLKDKEVRLQVERIWRANPNQKFFGRM